MLSRRRLFLLLALLCLLMGGFAAMHADSHDSSASACCLAGLGCAIAVAVVLLARGPGQVRSSRRRLLRSFARLDAPPRGGVVHPAAPGLAALCRLLV
jgi:hypothetical protein